jgi:hypothetical protein
MTDPLDKSAGLISKVIESYTGKMCYRIGNMIELVQQKYPEAHQPLQELLTMVRIYSLVFAPGDPSHPANQIHTSVARRVAENLPPLAEKPIIRPIAIPVSERIQTAAKKVKHTQDIREKTKKMISLIVEGKSVRQVANIMQCTEANVYNTRIKYKEIINELRSENAG